MRRADREEEILTATQKQRIPEEESKRMLAARFYVAAKKENKPFNPPNLGSNFQLPTSRTISRVSKPGRAAEQMKFAS
jgi:hypothetical protein